MLVDSRGMTLYTLSADGQDSSTCATQCLQFWPAVAPAKAGTLSVTTGKTATPDGTPIATVAGHPVYTFSQDQQPGDVNGEGINEFGGIWYAVSPTGQPVTAERFAVRRHVQQYDGPRLRLLRLLRSRSGERATRTTRLPDLAAHSLP